LTKNGALIAYSRSLALFCLYGLPGSLKSFILQDLFLRMARGGFWGGREVKQCPVVYIAAEASGGTKKRLFALRKALADKGESPAVPFFLITVAPNLGTGTGDCKKLIASIEGQLPPGIKPGALALDTTSQSMGGADENGAGGIGTKCVSLRQWREYANSRSTLEPGDTRDKNFERGCERLRAEKIIGIWKAYVWKA
jgi:AAA domain